MSIIEVKNISKKYIIGNQKTQYNSLRDDLVLAIKKPINWVKGARNQKEEFWALKDINFSVEKGEVLGIIGANGAGKSTLLKILSRITPPTEGTIKMKGRVGSLLEVGTGFHPELTGRENIYLNGAILGMKRKEIAKKFNVIVNFAGIEKFLDTPVKHYSSGMHVRLAFSVAAHLEPDVLIVDEVLAVGDAEFQKKCLGKMEEITKKDGRTILFVSHNMAAVQNLCQRALLLDKGNQKNIGPVNEIINKYLKEVLIENNDLKSRKDRKGNGKLKITRVYLKNNNGNDVSSFSSGEDVQIWFEYEVLDKNIREFNFSFGVDSFLGQNRIALISNKIVEKKIIVKNKQNNFIKIKIKNLPLNIGRYQITTFADYKGDVLDWVQGAGIFNVEYGNFYNTNQMPPQDQGSLLFNYDFIQ